MNELKILSEKEKKEITEKLSRQFGIKNIPGIFLKRSVERIFYFKGIFNEGLIRKLEKIVYIERAGIYFGKEQNGEIRLSVDGVHLFKEQINKNIIEINEEELERWMKGNELNINTKNKKGFVVLKHKDDFVGTGKASEDKITNFIPKNRRLKERN
ncbi:MAG: hypothetical protein ABH804_02065 [archaeon]